MISPKKDLGPLIEKKQLPKMRGQAIPLFGYHAIREYVLKEITGEFQSSILYWAGKNLARQFDIQSHEECRDFFLELGWGYLEQQSSTQHIQRFTLESPFFDIRNTDENQTTFALECGFLTEALANIEDKDTEGEFKPITKNHFSRIQFTVYLQEKESEGS